jgi:hypothetical protein
MHSIYIDGKNQHLKNAILIKNDTLFTQCGACGEYHYLYLNDFKTIATIHNIR